MENRHTIELSERAKELSKERTRLLGKIAGTRALEVGSILSAGFALSRKNLPGFALSSMTGAFFHFRRRAKKARLGDIDDELSTLNQEQEEYALAA